MHMCFEDLLANTTDTIVNCNIIVLLFTLVKVNFSLLLKRFCNSHIFSPLWCLKRVCLVKDSNALSITLISKTSN